jgi:hypothetical protein
MMDYHKEAFDAFKIVHEKYTMLGKKYQEEFNEEGEKILNIIRKYENLLCNYSEGGKYGKFSNKTAETFWQFIKKAFPKIDFIGLK